jgi:hypothetical protein
MTMRTLAFVAIALAATTADAGPGGGGGYIPEYRPRGCGGGIPGGCGPTNRGVIETRRDARIWISEISHPSLADGVARVLRWSRYCVTDRTAGGVLRLELDVSMVSGVSNVRAWGLDERTNDCVRERFDGNTLAGSYDWSLGMRVTAVIWINEPPIARLHTTRPFDRQNGWWWPSSPSR